MKRYTRFEIEIRARADGRMVVEIRDEYWDRCDRLTYPIGHPEEAQFRPFKSDPVAPIIATLGPGFYALQTAETDKRIDHEQPFWPIEYIIRIPGWHKRYTNPSRALV